jgi:hypothetical protein
VVTRHGNVYLLSKQRAEKYVAEAMHIFRSAEKGLKASRLDRSHRIGSFGSRGRGRPPPAHFQDICTGSSALRSGTNADRCITCTSVLAPRPITVANPCRA